MRKGKATTPTVIHSMICKFMKTNHLAPIPSNTTKNVNSNAVGVIALEAIVSDGGRMKYNVHNDKYENLNERRNSLKRNKPDKTPISRLYHYQGGGIKEQDDKNDTIDADTKTSATFPGI